MGLFQSQLFFQLFDFPKRNVAVISPQHGQRVQMLFWVATDEPVPVGGQAFADVVEFDVRVVLFGTHCGCVGVVGGVGCVGCVGCGQRRR